MVTNNTLMGTGGFGGGGSYAGLLAMDPNQVRAMLSGGGGGSPYGGVGAGAGLGAMPPSGGAGGVGGLFGGGGTWQDLMKKQEASSAGTKAFNRGTWADLSGYAKQVPRNYAADPLTQAARGRSAALIADPEAINDQTQQRIINRATNIGNAQANAQREASRREMYGRGLVGGSQQRADINRIERNRSANMMNTATGLDIQRANQRNEDIQRAIATANQLSMSQAGLEAGQANNLLGNAYYEGYDDLSGYGALMGLGAGGGGGFSLAGGGGGGYKPQQYAGGNWQGLNAPAGPSWSPYGLPFGTGYNLGSPGGGSLPPLSGMPGAAAPTPGALTGYNGGAAPYGALPYTGDPYGGAPYSPLTTTANQF